MLQGRVLVKSKMFADLECFASRDLRKSSFQLVCTYGLVEICDNIEEMDTFRGR